MSKVKFMLVYYFDSMNIVHKQWVPAAQTANQYYYTEILKRLRKWVMQIRPNIAINWILYHDNAPTHAALSVAQFVMPQPPYSPDLATCDFFLFQKVKSAVKGHHFESTENIQRAVTQALNDIPPTAFQE